MLENKFDLPRNWEQDLEAALLRHGRRENRIYICSPLRGADWKEVQRNMLAARFYMYLIWVYDRQVARAPHAYLPLLYCDDVPKERGDAITWGMRLVANCGGLYVCGNRITEGMRGEIKHAITFQRPVTVFNPDIFDEVDAMFRKARADRMLLIIETERQYKKLGLSAEELFEGVPCDD
ncbi:MAG: hypothetical protein FWC27_14630 [Firmicutes bacterium]|nr:hypothetical protein [Bacillota bacterium]